MNKSGAAPSEGPFLFRHTCAIQIRFGDVDVAGHVNNAVYQHYFDTAKLSYFRFLFNEVIDWKREGLVLASIKIDYFIPIYLEDDIEVLSRIVKIGNKSMHIVQEIRNKNDNSVLASATSVMVAYNFVSKEAIEIPVEWIRQIHKNDPLL